MDELDLTAAESKAIYEEIKKYVAENFNLSKLKDAKQPLCPKEKEKAVMEALKAFQMI